ncbi:two-component sensor histidine kinase [Lentzea sp. NBRC 105346]|uniref:sensor histidine kinase n=1 Tax=Lentzea sp. NBRC 105346 TaxID=3032205 RepID=UPI0024A588E8|nr:ATP-binding protein [Lentzea sp. NBRC 105346]GLZ34351.1 two-component sensor histidine kinase [Lentzea sp. NBRC 105346]
MNLRTRLTAWYGGVFLIAGAALVAICYALVASTLPGAGGVAFQAAEPLDPVLTTDRVTTVVAEYRADALHSLLVWSIVALVVAALLAVALGWVVAGRVLAPLQSITATAHRLEAERLDQRINLDGPDDELKELADTFDGMLDRLAGAFDSQKRFVANASHELRTPLAVQRTLIEVSMAGPESTPELERLGRHLLDANERSERLIDGLLQLARSDRGLATRGPVRLDRIVDEEIESCADMAAEHDVEIKSFVRRSVVEGDPVLLEQLVGNLLRNAIVHNVPGGHVDVRLDEVLTITNTGPVVPADAVPGLFEPFRRLRADRTGGVSGSGLGLSIVRSVVRAHQGAVRARPNGGGGLVVEVNLRETKVRQPS